MFEPGDALILAISAGLDSMVMLDLVQNLPNRIIVCHVNHGQRGNESDCDEAFIKAYCAERDITIRSQDIGAKLENAESGNFHQRARELRYQFFESTRNAFDAKAILTAHHADDVIEGLIHNFIRGTGLKGLQGIPVVNGFVKRPLLNITKGELIDYARTNKIDYREDSSNEKLIYNRNRIRLELLPLIEDILPHSERRLRTTLSNLQRDHQALNSLLDHVKSKMIKGNQSSLSLDKQMIYEMGLTEHVMFHILDPYGFSYTQVANLMQHLDHTGIKIHSNNWTLINERDILLLETSVDGDSFDQIQLMDGNCILKLTDQLSIEYVVRDYYAQIINEYDICLDKDKLSFPLTIRKWRTGDNMASLGMSGKRQKIAKILRDQKIANHQKTEQLVVESEDEICWLIPYKISELFKVESSTQHVACFSLIKS